MDELAIGSDDVVVSHVARIMPVKRSRDVVSSAAIALESDPRLLYLVVGDGPSLDEMRRECGRSGLEARFRFVGWVDHERVPSFLNLSDLVVLPSAYETQALVYFETQACGCLILASDVAGAREVIEDGETGLLFRAGDIEDLAAKTLWAAGRPVERERIGALGREQVRAYGLDRAVSAHEELLHTVVEPPA